MSLTVSAPPGPRRPAAPRATPKRSPLSIGLAVAAHGVVIAALLHIAVRPLRQAAEPPGFAMILPQASPLQAPPAPASSGTPPAPAQAAPAPHSVQPAAPRPATPAPARARPAPPGQTRVQAALRSHPAARPVAPAVSVPPDAGAGHAAPAPPPAVDTGATLALLETRIDQAVRAAARMPDAALRQRRQGRAQLRFDYTDGAVDAVQVVQSSNSRVLDDAAVRAVRQASYPASPPSLHGRRLSLQLWIDFHLAASQG